MQEGQYISEDERAQAIPIGLSSALHANGTVVFSYGSKAQLTFAFNDDFVEARTPESEPIRLKLSELTRFDIDYITREGDDKTHYYFFILLEKGDQRLVFYDREPEYVYNPIPGLTRKDLAELNLGALAHLANLEIIRSPFGKVEPWKAFRKEGEKGPPRTPEQLAKDEQYGGALGCAAFVFMLFGFWLLWRRWPRQPE